MDAIGRGINLLLISSRNYYFRVNFVQPNSPHSILAFLVPILQDFIELQYQTNLASPFETHPKTMWVVVASLLLYGFALEIELRHFSAYSNFLRRGKVLTGSVLLVSLLSILFPADSARLVLYLLCALFLATQFLQKQCQMFLDWLSQRMFSNPQRSRGRYRGGLLPLYLQEMGARERERERERDYGWILISLHGASGFCME